MAQSAPTKDTAELNRAGWRAERHLISEQAKFIVGYRRMATLAFDLCTLFSPLERSAVHLILARGIRQVRQYSAQCSTCSICSTVAVCCCQYPNALCLLAQSRRAEETDLRCMHAYHRSNGGLNESTVSMQLNTSTGPSSDIAVSCRTHRASACHSNTKSTKETHVARANYQRYCRKHSLCAVMLLKENCFCTMVFKSPG